MQLTDLLTLLIMNESQLYLKPSLQHFSQEAFCINCAYRDDTELNAKHVVW